MTVTKALGLSLVLHAVLFSVLQSGFRWAPSNDKRVTAIEAKLMLKDKPRPLDLLPRKQPARVPKALEAAVPVKKNVASKPPPKPAFVPKRVNKVSRAKVNYAGELARLSHSFAAQLAVEDEAKEPVQEWEDDGNYFDQIYSLIKKSFVVPPHINGPQGKNLQAVLRLFLSADGHLARLDLERSSGDEHFDKAVMDGTRRVNNFGAVPLVLQSALSSNGVVVEMCPFKCAERRGG